MPLETVADLWTSYSRAVMPDVHPDSIQYVETRRAFYAGVYAMLGVAEEIGEDTVSEMEGWLHMQGMGAECEAFYELVKTGKA